MPTENETAQPVEPMLECSSCREMTAERQLSSLRAYRGSLYCQSCIDNHFVECQNCSMTINIDDSYSHDDDTLCHQCYNGRSHDNMLCREYSSEPITSHNYGEIIKSRRSFGLEIECLTSERNAIARAMPTLGVQNDGSVQGDYGVEFQTPIMSKKAGEDYVKQLCKLLKTGEVNQSCGLHVHLSAEDVKSRLQTIWRFYTVFDNVILSFLPASRRSNTYCKPISKLYSHADIQNNSGEGLELLWYSIPRGTTRSRLDEILRRVKGESKHGSRYCGINLHTLITDGHLEVRYHSATLSAKKILYWVKLHQSILDTIKENMNMGSLISKADSMLSIVEKTQYLFDDIETR